MKKIIIVFLLMFATVYCKAQNASQSLNASAPVVADKNTILSSGNDAVQINAVAVPFSEKDKVVQSYPGYHSTIVTGNEQPAIEKTFQAVKANNLQSNTSKKAITTKDVQNNASSPVIEVIQKAEKVK